MSAAPSFRGEIPSVAPYEAEKPQHPNTPTYEGLEGIALCRAQAKHELAIIDHEEKWAEWLSGNDERNDRQAMVEQLRKERVEEWVAAQAAKKMGKCKAVEVEDVEGAVAGPSAPKKKKKKVKKSQVSDSFLSFSLKLICFNRPYMAWRARKPNRMRSPMSHPQNPLLPTPSPPMWFRSSCKRTIAVTVASDLTFPAGRI